VDRDIQLALLSSLSQSEFKQFKKALRVLTGARINLFTATEILLGAIETKRISLRELRKLQGR